MERREFGNTGYSVSIIGFGAGHIGHQDQDETEIEKLLNKILDLDINLIDTARSYGLSEERIGKFLSHRRKEFVIATKGGYDSQWHPNWTYDCILDNIDESLKRLRTDFIDIYQLHSCPVEVLEQGEVIRALEKAKDQGKIGIAAYSGENEALDYAIGSGKFGSIQCSVNICDQHAMENQIKKAAISGLGVIAKRPIANAPWRFDSEPVGHHYAEYWHRFRQMEMKDLGMHWSEVAIRFSAFAPGVSTIITGTSNPFHLMQNIHALEKGPLHDDVFRYIRDQFRKHDQNWTGLI